jgi:hypothetical protein
MESIENDEWRPVEDFEKEKEKAESAAQYMLRKEL